MGGCFPSLYSKLLRAEFRTRGLISVTQGIVTEEVSMDFRILIGTESGLSNLS